MTLADSVGIEDVLAAGDTIAPHAHRTMTATSRTLDAKTGATVVLKCENLQRIGSFKFRGACNAMSRLSDDAKQRGIITYSSGNHAQAIALASKLLGVPAVIVMPTDAPAVKLEATRGYLAGTPGEVVLYDRVKTTREALGAKLAEERGLELIPPYDHPHVIAGQGTAAIELINDAGSFDLILTPCGGGGLLSGSAVAAKALLPDCTVVGVEPALADDATRSFKTGKLCTVENPPTIADGARTPCLGRYTFPLIMRHVDDMTTVTEAETVSAMRFVWERMKLVIEPTGALGVAGLLQLAEREPERVRGKRVGIILSGGNVDLGALGGVFSPQGAMV